MALWRGTGLSAVDSAGTAHADGIQVDESHSEWPRQCSIRRGGNPRLLHLPEPQKLPLSVTSAPSDMKEVIRMIHTAQEGDIMTPILIVPLAARAGMND